MSTHIQATACQCTSEDAAREGGRTWPCDKNKMLGETEPWHLMKITKTKFKIVGNSAWLYSQVRTLTCSEQSTGNIAGVTQPYWKEATELSEAKGRGAWVGRHQPGKSSRGAGEGAALPQG